MAGEKVVYKGVPGDEKYEGSAPKIVAPKGFGTRHTQVLVLFISLTVAYTMRAQLSVSMVAMTGHMVVDEKRCNVNGSDVSCEKEEVGPWSVYRTYNWNKSTQEMIMFAFFVGYTTMMIPMGIIAQRFGGKFPISVALAVNGVVSIVSPWVPIFSGWIGLATCRLIQGMTQAAFYPSIHTMLGKWAPMCERGRLSTYVYTGSQFGTILIFQISGVFAGTPVLGWPAVFWLCGVLSFFCFGLLTWLVAATPHEHSSISTEELAYIQQDGCADAIPKKRRTPWKQILSSTAVWGLVVSHAGSAAGYLLMMTQMPTYMNEILNVDIKNNGLFSSLPYLSMFIMANVFGYLSDYLLNNRLMTLSNIRRSANTIGMVISGIFLIAFCYVDTAWLAVLMLVLSFGMHSAVHSGFHINQIDLSPNFAGPIMSLGNMVANLTGLLDPVIVSTIVQDDLKNHQRWQIVFLIAAAFQFLTNAVFVVFVKTEVQPWNFYDEDRTETLEELKTFNEKKSSLKEKEKLGN